MNKIQFSKQFSNYNYDNLTLMTHDKTDTFYTGYNKLFAYCIGGLCFNWVANNTCEKDPVLHHICDICSFRLERS